MKMVIYLTDRKAFMIISGGVNIYPKETEDTLIMHPKVADVAVLESHMKKWVKKLKQLFNQKT